MYRIILSELAGKKLDILLDYLELEWSVTISDDFMNIFNQKLDQIAIYPESCKRSKIFFNLHQCVVTKQTSFLYRIKNTEIEIITVFDNRSDFKLITNEIHLYYTNLK